MTRLAAAFRYYEYAFHWLDENAPESEVRKLVHGDFRMGNLMITAIGSVCRAGLGIVPIWAIRFRIWPICARPAGALVIMIKSPAALTRQRLFLNGLCRS